MWLVAAIPHGTDLEHSHHCGRKSLLNCVPLDDKTLEVKYPIITRGPLPGTPPDTKQGLGKYDPDGVRECPDGACGVASVLMGWDGGEKEEAEAILWKVTWITSFLRSKPCRVLTDWHDANPGLL